MKKRFFAGLLTVLCVAGTAMWAEQMPHIHRIPHDAQMDRATGPICLTGVPMAVVVDADGVKSECSYEDTFYLMGLVAGTIFRTDDVCRCEAEMEIRTDMGTVELSLKNAFVRCERGQASLTQEQLQKIGAMKAIRELQKWNKLHQ